MEKVTTQEKNQGPRLGKSFRQGTQACLKHEVQKKKKKVKERKKKGKLQTGRKMLANHIYHQGIVSMLYKEP